MITIPIADIINWGWLRIGPPYIYININPALAQLGPLKLNWYGLMYVVGIVIALMVIKGYTERKGIDQDTVYRVLWWCIPAGLIGGRLYFVIQQPNLFSYYLTNPIHIIATWEGGMAFYGAIFLVIPTLFWRARVERINPLVLIDAGVLFAAVGQIFGRIGNLINGDIVGYPSRLPWSTVYTNPASWACQPGSTICGVPVQPAAGYELLTNLVLLTVMLFLARRVRRPGILMLVYLHSYAITQFFLFFVRDNIYVKLFNVIDWHLKQAQWTSIAMFIVLLPITYLVIRSSKPVPAGEVAATYGIPQKPADSEQLASRTLDGEVVKVEDGEIKHVDHEQAEPETIGVTPVQPEHESVEDGEIKHVDNEQVNHEIVETTPAEADQEIIETTPVQANNEATEVTPIQTDHEVTEVIPVQADQETTEAVEGSSEKDKATKSS